jgi:hypothetical protein
MQVRAVWEFGVFVFFNICQAVLGDDNNTCQLSQNKHWVPALLQEHRDI